MPHRGGADNQRTISHGFGNGLVLFRRGEQLRSADCGTSFAECGFERSHDAQAEEAEIAHGPRGSADVEGIARGHQDDAQTIKFKRNGQECLFYLRLRAKVRCDS